LSWGDDLAAWWLEEVASDPAYGDEVVPLALEMLQPRRGSRYLDLGCGDGRLMEVVGASGAAVFGCDISGRLAKRASGLGPSVVCRLPDLSWVKAGCLDGAYAVLVLEHIEDAGAFFEAAQVVVRAGGVLALVANHPAFTAPGSGPVVDPSDGEVTWRWGTYLDCGSTREPAGHGHVVFHHRPLGLLLSAAADAGWRLDQLMERGIAPRRADEDPLLDRQRNAPRLLGVRWLRA
jgi:SAM-dependent methyltransferase